MQYLVQMRLSTAGLPTTSEDGVAFIEQFDGRALSLRPRLDHLKAQVPQDDRRK